MKCICGPGEVRKECLNCTPMQQPVLCEHANENPNVCPCGANCFCRIRTCKDKPLTWNGAGLPAHLLHQDK